MSELLDQHHCVASNRLSDVVPSPMLVNGKVRDFGGLEAVGHDLSGGSSAVAQTGHALYWKASQIAGRKIGI
jgi:hypothetical protein